MNYLSRRFIWLIAVFGAGVLSSVWVGRDDSFFIIDAFYRPLADFVADKETILMTADGFLPSHLEMHLGRMIRFVNRDTVPHWPASNLHPLHSAYPEFDPKGPVEPGRVWVFRPTKAGVWFFHDHLHPENGGRIAVSIGKMSNPADEKKLDWTKERGRELMMDVESAKDRKKQLELMGELAYRVGPVAAIELLNDSALPRYGETHLLSHKIGEAAYAIYGEEALPYCKDDMLNGCVHGLLLTAISDIGFSGVRRMVENCRELSLFKYHMCLHASGHAFVAFADYDILEPLRRCEELGADPGDLTHCYNGVFMENAHGEHDGQPPATHRWLNAKDLLYPCPAVAVRYQGDCYLNQAGWWYQVFLGDLKKTVEYCSNVPKEYLGQCANNVGRVISTAVSNDPDEIRKNCGYLPGSWPEKCLTSIANSVYALGNENLPFALCSGIRSAEGKRNCYQELGWAFKTHGASSEKRRDLCLKFDEAFQNLCE